MERMTILDLDDKKRSGDFFGGELLSVFQCLKGAKAKTSRQMGYLQIYVPEDWIAPVAEAAMGRTPTHNLFLIKMPVKAL